MITKEEVKHIANLARLGLTEKEIGKYQKDLSSIFDYFKKLEKVDVSQTKPTSHPFSIENAVRKDIVKKESRKMIEGFLKVKSILK